MRVAIAVAAIFLARFAVGAWFDPGRDGDIAWQQWLGLRILQSGHIPLALGKEAFSAPGAPWVPQEWALSVLVALTVGTPHFIAIVAIAALAGAAALLLTAWSCVRLGASAIATGAVTFCTGFAMVESFGIRAQVFAWAMLAAFVLVLRTCSGRTRWLLPLITAVWANLHASAMLAPALAACWSIGTAIEDRGWSPRVRRNVLLAAACAGAVFLTPLGYRLPLYAIALVQSPIRSAIQEWQPAGWSAAPFAAGAFPLVVLSLFFALSRQRRWTDVLLLPPMAWMTFGAARNVPVCAIVLAPAVAQGITAYLPERVRVNAMLRERAVLALLYCAALTAAAVSALMLARTPQFSTGTLPGRAIAALGAVPGTHALYCEDFAWCSSALAYPNVREFIDGRADPFPLPVWRDYETVAAAKPGWQSVLDRRGVDAVVVKRSSKLGREMRGLRGWRELYADKSFRVFIRERAGSSAA